MAGQGPCGKWCAVKPPWSLMLFPTVCDLPDHCVDVGGFHVCRLHSPSSRVSIPSYSGRDLSPAIGAWIPRVLTVLPPFQR